MFTVRYGLSLKLASREVVLILIYLLTAIGLTSGGSSNNIADFVVRPELCRTKWHDSS